MSKHKIPCWRISDTNLLCIDICRVRARANRPCHNCVYYNTLRCSTLKQRFQVKRPSEIDYENHITERKVDQDD